MRFVILAVGRSRSSLLVDLLNKSPHVVCHSELFHAEHIYCREDHLERLGVDDTTDIAARDRDPAAFLDRVYAERASDEVRAIGFKFLHAHDPRVMEHVLAERSIAKIVLKRNFLFSFTSLRLAIKTNKWTHFGVPNRDHERVSVAMRDFLWYCDQYVEYYAAIDAAIDAATARHRRLTLYAEDVHENDPGGAMRRIFHFLGVPAPATLQSDFKRQNAATLRDRIENHEEFLAELAETRWAGLPLEDVHPANRRRRQRGPFGAGSHRPSSSRSQEGT